MPNDTTHLPKLLEQLRDKVRHKHYSLATERQYVHWAKRFILFHHKRHPQDMGAVEVEAFLTHLAVDSHVSASTQNQALSALRFVYREVLEQDLPWLQDVVMAKRPTRLPVVLTQPSRCFAMTHPNSPAQALLLAAGRGERMRPLTDTTPKPLLAVQGKPLMQWHLEALARGGVRSVCINTAWLGEHIAARFGPSFTPSLAAWEGTGPAPQLALHYSMEGQDFGGALETAGGMVRALPLLDDVFWLLAGDVFAPEFAFSNAVRAAFVRSPLLAHIWLVPNPDHNPQGDFGVAVLPGGRLLAHNGADAPRHTYSTIGLYKKSFFAQPWCAIAAGNPEGISAPLAPMLRAAISAGQVGASVYPDRWVDVGTPERLAALNACGPVSAALH